ncbi:MarR family transcriptional regulator [Stieleria sp. JC731]|uniref:MarR family winged helix-turn-helix transcriptional regulator n=1 Tax=Pirellulaceae TaxID=2691357 RepID=UPI001E60A91A|nr:MarR family transcriptional regulator [Stieleria sp. JC731]MCC9600710.1 MarR family transcriptional regulator [Stieleria sp. JC731]
MEPQTDLPLALRAAYLSLHRNSDACFSDHGITADQFVLMSALAEGNALTQRELACRISSDPSTIRAMLVLLEDHGMVRRKPHPTDSRAKTVSLTAAGKRKVKKLGNAGQPIRDCMYEALSPAEAKKLVKLLGKVSDALKDYQSSCV